ncbi:MAG: 2-amino-4-hydroxy-6-hydroxymethyldihydropteridine diphosphokinase [Alphaproteobacteria bacterium]|nr:2-amino-4-hydroxy-6-hydroxymethyldihydropteridine diphosphokinase [Alphaproteobacteria bacterium]
MIVVALGANLDSQAGRPRETLLAALEALKRKSVRILALSPFYRTRAWPDPSDPDYVNAVASVATERGPRELMELLEQTETLFGRKRSERNAPRTLDLDLIDYDGRVEQGPPILPHPRMRERGFVLVPLSDIAPAWRHPVGGESVQQLIESLPDAREGMETLNR